jgi:hypothetical protein
MNRRIYPLCEGVSFETLSEHMDACGAELTRLEGCAFPSRPEARLATWSYQSEPVARYRYEPDLELRWFAWDRPDLFERNLPSEWGIFDDWNNLRADLHSGEWRRVFRAATAFRVAAENREPDVDGEAVLAEALSGPEYTLRAAASQLATIATTASRDAIELALSRTDTVETRVDLRRALDKIDMDAFRR